MLKIKNIMVYVFAALLLTACGGGAPDGTDSEVKDLVIQITNGEIRKNLAPVIYQKITNVPVRLVGLKISYDGLIQNIDKDRNSEVVAAIDEAMEKISVTLENIRTDGSDDEIKKSELSADIVINGKSSPIQYTAQINSDGDLYVEVFGL